LVTVACFLPDQAKDLSAPRCKKRDTGVLDGLAKCIFFFKVAILGWAGHIIRVEEERIPTKVLNEKLHSRSSVGKPRTRWEDVGQTDSLQVLGI